MLEICGGITMKQVVKTYVIITLGVLILTAGLIFFLIPADLAVGGITGIAMVIKKWFPSIDIGLSLMVMNMLLFIIGFWLIGHEFGVKTIYAALSLSGAIWITERFFPIEAPLTDDVFINLFFGILISAIGMGVIFYQNASTGGTDIIAKIMNKYFYIDIGKSLLAVDFIVTLLAVAAFGPKLGLYALLGVIMNGFLIDNVIEGLDLRMKIHIVSREHERIARFITGELERGATVYDARGAFTGEEKTVLVSVMNKREYIRLKKFIKEIDSEAFVTIAHVREVFGEGFKLNA
jgi:uncharacterized membrane-anchored protein YitT (DUF2179 family)